MIYVKRHVSHKNESQFMIDYQITIQKIIESITHFSFEFDFEEIKREMVLVEVPQSELESLGEEEIWKNFYSGVYKIKLPDGKLIDTNSIRKYCIENNIQEPVIFINPEFKYVHWSFSNNN